MKWEKNYTLSPQSGHPADSCLFDDGAGEAVGRQAVAAAAARGHLGRRRTVRPHGCG